MTKAEILTRRKALEEQHKTVIGAYYRVTGDEATAIHEAAQAKTALERGQVEHARGILAVDIKALFEASRAADERVDEVKQQSNATYRARTEVEEELSTHLALHFDTFAEDAVKMSKKAEEALRKVLRATMTAERVWREAAASWAPLCRAKSLSGVPQFPLVRGGAIPARPPSVTSTGEADAA